MVMEKSGDYRSTFFGRNLMVLSRVLFIRILLVPHHSHRINLSFDALLCLISTLGDPPPSPSSLRLTSLLVFLERKLYRTRRGRGRMDFIFGGEYHATTTTTTTTTTSLPPKMKSHHPLPLQQIESRKEIQFLRIPAHFSLKHGCPGG